MQGIAINLTLRALDDRHIADIDLLRVRTWRKTPFSAGGWAMFGMSSGFVVNAVSVQY